MSDIEKLIEDMARVIGWKGGFCEKDCSGENCHHFARNKAALRSIADATKEERDRLREALEGFMNAMAFSPSSVPGAIEHDLKAAYEKGQAILNAPKNASQFQDEWTQEQIRWAEIDCVIEQIQEVLREESGFTFPPSDHETIWVRLREVLDQFRPVTAERK